jgi:dynein heavy chain
MTDAYADVLLAATFAAATMTLPTCSTEAPEVFGMHANANIAFQLQETRRLLDAVLTIQPRISGGSGSSASSSDTVVATLCAETLEALPPDLDLSEAAAGLFERMPDGKLNSLSVVLGQEVERFQRLAAVLRQSLVALQAAIRGQVVMSAELEAAYNALLLNQVSLQGSTSDSESMVKAEALQMRSGA